MPLLILLIVGVDRVQGLLRAHLVLLQLVLRGVSVGVGCLACEVVHAVVDLLVDVSVLKKRFTVLAHFCLLNVGLLILGLLLACLRHQRLLVQELRAGLARMIAVHGVEGTSRRGAIE